MLRITPLLLVGLLVSCGDAGPREGDSCTMPSFVCADATSMMECVQGSYRRVECAGPDGCSDNGDGAFCDDRRATPEAPCMAGHEGGYACSVDATQALRCQAGAWRVHDACADCSIQDHALTCGVQAGGECQVPSYACADEGTALECVGGRFQAIPCRGPQGCSVSNDGLACDNSIAQDGDACLSTMPDAQTCNLQASRRLQCDGSRWNLHAPCTGCRRDGGSLVCGG